MKKNKFLNYDVIIIGAGVAGLAAAVTCARKRAKVLVVERNDFLGGNAVAAMNNSLCGVYLNTVNFPRKVLNPGIIEEFILFLSKKDKSSRFVRRGKVNIFEYNPASFIGFIDKLVKKENNLDIILSSAVFEVKKENDRITALGFRKDKQVFFAKAGFIIDCSGNAIVSQLAKNRVNRVSRNILGGFAVCLENIGLDEILGYRVSYCMNNFVRQMCLNNYLKFVNFFPIGNAMGIVRFNFPYGKNIKQIYKDVSKSLEYLKKSIDAFRQAKIKSVSPYLALRQDSVMHGEYILTGNDILSCRKFSDVVVKGCWPVELWDQGKGPVYKYISDGKYYEIPMRVLKSKYIVNLYSAGRCISADIEAIASLRVMGTCISLGEAAGLAVMGEI